MGQIIPEILDLCEVRKFCDDPASRSANWDQVNQLFYQFQRNLSNSKISLKLIEYFVHLVPVCGLEAGSSQNFLDSHKLRISGKILPMGSS